jgi:uncharacterized repeat protein (TIGR01451 family)
MRPVSRCWLKITTSLLIGVLATLGSFTFLALAQTPSPFEIKVVPQADYAVAGRPFTYTIVITNISPMPVQDVIVFMETPTGTTFVSASQHANWFTSGLNSGETGKVGWATIEPIIPNAVVTFQLSLNVLPEMADQKLANSEYAIIPMGGGDVIAFGSPVEIQVLATMPTATPTPSPTATSRHTSTPTTTPPPPPSPTLIINTVTPVSAVAPPADPTGETITSSSTAIFIMTGVPVLIILVIALMRFWRRR